MTAIEIRVRRGEATAEELAVLTAVLLARAAAGAASRATGAGSAWQPDGFEAPHSWHSRPPSPA
ncbi:acyl-CoA carboxylase epsilon subunit [Kitasatospora sp. NPDC008050]|uniref:acyl-CoA carboxylase epsilon subunit n=1 Tax=Kitasatospora sp. NPDC008050 TaxID=3364021 RepID=UPI0036E4959F